MWGMSRPTFEELITEQDAFIGPKEPPRGPKMKGSGPYWNPTDAQIRSQFPGIFENDHHDAPDDSDA